MKKFDLEECSVRDINAFLHNLDDAGGETTFEVDNPKGKHNIAVGVDGEIDVTVNGHAGHYVGGMNKHANITVTGNAGSGTAENIMSGVVRVKGNSSQYAGATGRGGLLVVEGNAAARCGISMKGVDIVVGGDVGHMCAFLGQSGNVVICGDAGDAMGDSIFELNIFVQGKVKSLGHDCEEKEMGAEQLAKLTELLDKAQIDADPNKFKVYGPQRSLYNFKIDNAHL